MKNLLALFLSSFLSFSAYADETADPKMLQVGFGTYVIVVGYDDAYYEEDVLTGITLAIRGSLSDNFAIHGNFYSTDHEDLSAIENTGTDIIAYFGKGLQSKGFKVYAGGGIFNETWELSGYEVDFSGIQFSGGIGHNWDNVAIDFMLSIRDPSDYEDFIYDSLGGSVTAAAVSGSMQLSARF